MKPGKGEQPLAEDSDIEAELQGIVRSFAEDDDPLHEGEIRAIRQELERRRKVEGLTRTQKEILAELAGGPTPPKTNQPDSSSSEEEAQGEITLTHAPDPPWLEQAFREVFQDPVGRFERYLRKLDSDLDRMKLESMRARTDWLKDMHYERPLIWDQQFAQPLIPESPQRSLDLAPDSPFSNIEPSRSFDRADLPTLPERDFYTQAADEIAYRFGLGPAFRDWLSKEGPKLGAEKMIDLTKQFAEYLEKTSGAGQPGSARPVGPIPPSAGQDGPGPLEVTVRGQKIKIPDVVVQTEVRFNLEEAPKEIRDWLWRRFPGK